MFVTVGARYDGTLGDGYIYASEDGVTWTEVLHRVAANAGFFGVHHNGLDTWVVVGTEGIVRSTDGITWTDPDAGPDVNGESYSFMRDIHYYDGIWVAAGDFNVAVSTDAVTWLVADPDQFTGTIGSKAVLGKDYLGSTYWFIAGESKTLYRTDDPTALTGWTNINSGVDFHFTDGDGNPDFLGLTPDGNDVWLTGMRNGLWYSEDNGDTFTVVDSPPDFGFDAQEDIWAWEYDPEADLWIGMREEGVPVWSTGDPKTGAIAEIDDYPEIAERQRGLTHCNGLWVAVGGQAAEG